MAKIFCLFCGTEIEIIDKYSKRKKFCNRSCSGSYNSLRRSENGFSLKDKKKIVKCLDCDVEFAVGVNSSDNIRCPNCAHKKIINDYHTNCGANSNYLTICSDCGIEVYGCKGRKYCDECGRLRVAKGARNSITLQGNLRRSKNEIYFAELCINYFGQENIKVNEPMFDGWDADIIIESKKVAVLWNGKWHYEKITVKHSVAQVQNRDKIKISKIEAYNYMPYVIKDMGSFDKDFVEREFISMVECLFHTQDTTDRNR